MPTLRQLENAAGMIVAIVLGFVAHDVVATTPPKYAPGWVADAGTGCRAWSEYATPIASWVPGRTVTWSGACEDGNAQGPGLLQWFVNGEQTERYEGTMRAGKKDGRGVFVEMWRGQEIRYEGEFRDDKMHGHGVTVFRSRRRHEGAYQDGKPHGPGATYDADGQREYEGEYRRGAFWGHGVWTGRNGDRYEGEFQAGREHGRGVYTWANGVRYDGEWSRGLPHGQGTTYAIGETYTGIWTNGCAGQIRLSTARTFAAKC